jgi:hypothetical protein
MSTYLRKCIDIAPTGVITPVPLKPNDYRALRETTWWPMLRATTSHLRLWADWPSLQPAANEDPGTAGKALESLTALDAQVDAALADGMKLVMLPYRYPRWSNGTEGLTTTLADATFEPWDRHARYLQYIDYLEGRRPDQAWKNLQYRMPGDGFGPSSAWGRFVSWLWERYADRLAAFEVVNEPNLQIWPQRSPVQTDVLSERWGTTGTDLVITPAVAEMMITVDGLARRHPGPVLLAPSTSDSDVATVPRSTTISHANPYAMSTDPFVESLLGHLDARGFVADDRWVWSFHNYADVERKQQHVVHLRRLLAERRWAGRRLDGGPELWCTEGGCRINAMVTRFLPVLGRNATVAEQKAYQGQVLAEGFARHHYAKGAGAGVGMLTQYLTYSDVNFESGLLDTVAAGGAARPAFYAWCDMPEYVAPPAPRAAWRPQP